MTTDQTSAPSLQEMFDRAVIGLAHQGFARCRVNRECRYDDGNGNRCAWGWVDTSLDFSDFGGLADLRKCGRGLAAKLDAKGIEFAEHLQRAHDYASNGAAEMVGYLREVAATYDLETAHLPLDLA